MSQEPYPESPHCRQDSIRDRRETGTGEQSECWLTQTSVLGNLNEHNACTDSGWDQLTAVNYRRQFLEPGHSKPGIEKIVPS